MKKKLQELLNGFNTSDSGSNINCSLLTNRYTPVSITPVKTESIYITLESSLMPSSQAVFEPDPLTTVLFLSLILCFLDLHKIEAYSMYFFVQLLQLSLISNGFIHVVAYSFILLSNIPLYELLQFDLSLLLKDVWVISVLATVNEAAPFLYF